MHKLYFKDYYCLYCKATQADVYLFFSSVLSTCLLNNNNNNKIELGTEKLKLCYEQNIPFKHCY